jgi:hypothetical protein
MPTLVLAAAVQSRDVGQGVVLQVMTGVILSEPMKILQLSTKS